MGREREPWPVPLVHLSCFVLVAKRLLCGTHEAMKLLRSLAHFNYGIPEPQEVVTISLPTQNPYNIQNWAARGTENKGGIERENLKGFKCTRSE